MTENRENKLKRDLEWKRKKKGTGPWSALILFKQTKQSKTKSINVRTIPIKGEVPKQLSILFKNKTECRQICDKANEQDPVFTGCFLWLATASFE